MSLRAAKPLALRGTERGRGFYAACRASPGQRPGPGHQPRERWSPTSCSGRGAEGACPHHSTRLVPAASLCGDGDTPGQPGMGPAGSPLPLGGFGTALGFGIAVVGPRLAWSGAPSPARPELAPLQTAGGCQRGIGQHRLAPDCHPPTVAASSGKPRPDRTARAGGVKHWDGENQPQKQLVGRGWGWAVPRRVAGGEQGLGQVGPGCSLPTAPCSRRSVPLSRALGAHSRTENSEAPGAQHQTSCRP